MEIFQLELLLASAALRFSISNMCQLTPVIMMVADALAQNGTRPSAAWRRQVITWINVDTFIWSNNHTKIWRYQSLKLRLKIAFLKPHPCLSGTNELNKLLGKRSKIFCLFRYWQVCLLTRITVPCLLGTQCFRSIFCRHILTKSFGSHYGIISLLECYTCGSRCSNWK